jgi:hypothetical protein
MQKIKFSGCHSGRCEAAIRNPAITRVCLDSGFGPSGRPGMTGGEVTIPQRLRLRIELLFPFLLVFGAFADEGREDRRCSNIEFKNEMFASLDSFDAFENRFG